MFERMNFRNMFPEQAGSSATIDHSELNKLLGLGSGGGSDDDDDPPQPAAEPKVYKSADGTKTFDTLEGLMGYIEQRNKDADIKLQSAAMLQKAAIETSRQRSAKPKDPEQMIDLTKIDLEADPAGYQSAVMQNLRIQHEETARIKEELELARQDRAEAEAQANLENSIIRKAAERGIAVDSKAVKDFLEKARANESVESSSEALLDFITHTQKSKTETVKPVHKTGTGPIVVPGGGTKKHDNSESMSRASERIFKLSQSGQFDNMTALERHNLTRAAKGLPPKKNLLDVDQE